MSKQSNNIFLIVLLAIIFLMIISALIIQYWLGHEPCKLCLYERIPYFLSILLLFQTLFFKKYQKNTLLILAIVFAGSAILAFYHLGIEESLFNEPLACSTENFSDTLSKQELLDQLKKSSISCKDVSFRILGLSLAAINSIFSLALSVIFIKLFINYEKN